MEHVVATYCKTNPVTRQRGRKVLLTLSLLALAACGGGGGKGNGGGGNTAPTANAGADRTVNELTAVNLNGAGNDADGDALTYSWLQTAGTNVTLTNANMAQASFTAPDVAAGNPEVLTFQLTVGDGTANTTDAINITVQEPAVVVRVSGTVSHEFVPPNANCQGLDLDNPVTRPIRGATVQLIDAGSGAVLDSMVSDGAGAYSFTNVDANTMVRLRVRAELKQAGTPSWDVEVRDNFIAGASDFDVPAPPPLGGRALYALDGSDFDTGGADVVRDLTAQTGWGGASYTGPRAAAPFAILDTIYSSVQFVLTADPNANFAPIGAFWSVNNTLTSPPDITAGELPTSFYSSGIDSLFLLGDASVDTEEFDDHVIVHEWGHYFEDTFSRSDSWGGAHAIGDRLDPSLAFGEGWATALSGMALGNQLYCDTGIPGTAAGFGIGTESGSYDARGWYDEISVVRFIYDMWDNNDDGGGSDTVAVGFTPIYNVMTGPQLTTESFTTIFSFAAALRASLNAGDQLGLDAQLAREDMTAAGLDIWGSGELNDAGGSPDVLPVYTDLTADGSVVSICANSQFDSGRTGNKLSEDRYLRISVPFTDQYDVSMVTTTATPVTPDLTDRDQSDPDIYIYRGAQYITEGTSPADNTETFRTPTLQGGQTYIAIVEEWRYDDDVASPTFPEQICFDISFTATP